MSYVVEWVKTSICRMAKDFWNAALMTSFDPSLFAEHAASAVRKRLAAGQTYPPFERRMSGTHNSMK